MQSQEKKFYSNATTDNFKLTNPFQTGSNQSQLDSRSVKPNDFKPVKGQSRVRRQWSPDSLRAETRSFFLPEQPPRFNRGVERRFFRKSFAVLSARNTFFASVTLSKIAWPAFYAFCRGSSHITATPSNAS
jgi:hypothetical protein